MKHLRLLLLGLIVLGIAVGLVWLTESQPDVSLRMQKAKELYSYSNQQQPEEFLKTLSLLSNLTTEEEILDCMIVSAPAPDDVNFYEAAKACAIAIHADAIMRSGRNSYRLPGK